MTSKNIRGNAAKYLSYREAWKRIKAAQKLEFYMEAVTIEESIIADRLISYLVGIEAIKRTNQLKKYGGLKNLIDRLKRHNTVPINTKYFDDLQSELYDWCNRRNNVVHGMVKSHPGTPTENVEDFLAEAKAAAKKGEELAIAVSQWVHTCKRQQNRCPGKFES